MYIIDGDNVLVLNLLTQIYKITNNIALLKKYF